MVVKAYQYTNLLSCMLLDACVYLPLIRTPGVTTTRKQVGDPIVRVLLVAIHADQVHMDPTRCMWLTTCLYRLAFN